MNKQGRLFAVILSAATLLSLAAGCQKASPVSSSGDNLNDKTPITLSVFFKTADLGWNTPVAKEVTKETGVTLNQQTVTGDVDEKLNVMLASNSIPDIVMIDRGDAAIDKFISAKAVIPLDPLMQKEGPDVISQLGNTKKEITYKDGHIYFIPSWFSSSVQPSPVFGFNMKMNWVKALGYYDTYTSKGYFTQEEFEELLKAFKQKYPTLNGHASIAMTFNDDNIGAWTDTFEGMYGLKAYYQTKDGIKNLARDPALKNMYMFMNKLYTEGLIDKDWPVNKTQLFNEKISGGYTFCAPAAYWDIPNSAFAKDSAGNPTPDQEFYPFKVVADGVKPNQTTYGPTSVLGWTDTFISANNKHPDRTMQFLNFLISEKGQYLTQWGREGVVWSMQNGKRVIASDYMKKLKADPTNMLKQEGARQLEIVFKSGVAKDGQNYDLQTAYNQITNSIDPVTAFANKYLGDTAYDTTEYDSLNPPSGTPEALIDTKLTDIENAALPKVILARTQNQANKLYDQMLQNMGAAGMTKVEKVENDNLNARKKLWGVK